jgi:transketolase
LPNMKVIAPSEVWEIHELTTQMLALGGPGYLRLDKSSGGSKRRPGEKTELGRARMLSDGVDVCIIAVGGIVSEVLTASAVLNEKGIYPKVIVLNSLKPIDKAAIIEASKKARVLLTVEEHSIIGGLGGAVAEICLEAGVSPLTFKRIGLDDQFPSIVGDQNYLRKVYKMDSISIIDAVIRGLNSKP